MRNISQIHHDTWGDREELLQDLGGTPSLIEEYAEEDVVTQSLALWLDVSSQAPPAGSGEPAPEHPLTRGPAARRLRLMSALRSRRREQIPKGKPWALPPLAAPALAATAVPARTPIGALPDETPTEPSMRVKRAVMVMSALAMLGVFLTMYVLSSGRDAAAEPDVDARPRPVRAVPAAKAKGEGVLAKGGEWQQDTAGALFEEDGPR